jgi:hypothetical protein
MRVQEKKRADVLDEARGLIQKIGNPKIENFVEIYLKRRKHLRFHKRDALAARTLLKYFAGKNFDSILPSDVEDYIPSLTLVAVQSRIRLYNFNKNNSDIFLQ